MINFFYKKIILCLYRKLFIKKTRKKWSTDNLPESEPLRLYSKL